MPAALTAPSRFRPVSCSAIHPQVEGFALTLAGFLVLKYDQVKKAKG
ncbi:hypothetical protein D187_010538 [Cystobacter fuscus DSM 2262]|uniref:Uncharacterized protein n=1 Tax=Cystobacter fuscus (strain ATCC 25194 / DSM 2262 / NBRC 100088 / M29) TaxID=1242864 RepID=S9QKV5_CYSF2|nr:hypothetical protein D187_010538 [Cystobacter fuscus DSM 2262]